MGATQQILSSYNTSGGSIWTPADLSPRFWVNDDSPVTDAGAGACSEWQDISGNAFHVGQASSTLRPLIITSGLNGRRTIRSDGANDSLTCSASGVADIFRDVSAAWVCLLYKMNATGVSAVCYAFASPTNNSTNTRFSFCSTATGTNTPQLRVRRIDGDSVKALDAGSSIGTEWNVWLATLDYSTGEGIIYKNWSVDSSNASLTSAGNTSNTAATSPSLSLFNFPTGGAPAGIEMAEGFAGVGTLDSTDRTNMAAYITARWGV